MQRTVDEDPAADPEAEDDATTEKETERHLSHTQRPGQSPVCADVAEAFHSPSCLDIKGHLLTQLQLSEGEGQWGLGDVSMGPRSGPIAKGWSTGCHKCVPPMAKQSHVQALCASPLKRF